MIENSIFKDNDAAVEFCLQTNVLKVFLDCRMCGFRMNLKKNSRKLNGKEYVCANQSCKKTKSIYEGFICSFPRIEIRKILLCAYYYILELTNYQAVIMADICEHTYIKLKKIFLRRLYEMEVRQRGQIGGDGVVFQVDETAVCRRGIIRNPTSRADEIRDTVWLIGIIQEDNPENLRLEVLPNRTVETLTYFFSRNVLPNSIIKSDGYPSYPRAIQNSLCTHVMVNHSEGFTNADGDHTNMIENIWSHFKTELRTRRGVMLENMSSFACEFVIFKKYNAVRSKENSSNFFKRLISSFIIT